MRGAKQRLSATSKYLILLAILSVLSNTALGVMLTYRANTAIKTQIQARMTDISNTAAAMLDGNILRTVTPAHIGTAAYEEVMEILTYFQDNIELEYIYCIRDVGGKQFEFGLDPTRENPAKFGDPVVYTDALYRASRGKASVDESSYEDAWGAFYSAYSPVFDAEGNVAGIVAVDFSREWYDTQIRALIRTTVYMCALALAATGTLVLLLIRRNHRRIQMLNEHLNQMADSTKTLMNEVRILTDADIPDAARRSKAEKYDIDDLDSLTRKISEMRRELQKQTEKVHEQACFDRATGVMNKEYYESVRHELDERIKKGSTEFAILIFSMNELSAINRNYGYERGDMALADAAGVIASVYGKRKVFRIGGGEFRVIAESMSESDIRNSILKVDFRMAAERIKDKPYRMPISFSVGHAAYDRTVDRESADVYRRAEHMMNREKEAYYTAHGEA